MTSTILYGIAFALIIYIVVNIAKTGRFRLGDAVALLGIVISVILALGEPLPNFVKSSTPTIDPTQPLLSDSFDDPAYNGKYNANLWVCNTCTFGAIVSQGDNSVRLEATNGNGVLTTQSSWLSYQIDYIQGRLKLENTDSGEINLGFHATLDSSNPWTANCFIQGGQSSTNQATYGCSIYTYINEQYKGEYGTEAFVVNYDEWHTVKIELVQKTLEIRFYFDNKLIGRHVPTDADELKNKIMGAGFGITTDTHIVGYVDSVIIQPAK